MTFTQVLTSGRFLCSEFSGGGGTSLGERAFADHATDARNRPMQSNTLKLPMPSCYNCICAQGYYS